MATIWPGDLANSILTGEVLHERQRSRDVVSSGFASLDALLPAGGVRRGSLIEWLLAGGMAGRGAAGSGAAGGGGLTLACAVACRLAGGTGASDPRSSGEGAGTIIPGTTIPGTIVIVDRSGWFHPPAVLPWLAASSSGGASSGGARLIVVRPAHDDDELWAIDQALRCPGVTAVVAWPQAIQAGGNQAGGNQAGGKQAGAGAGHKQRASQRASVMRRWQLAARASGAVGLIVRSAAVRGEPCWSEARIAVTPLPSVPVRQNSLLQSSLLERRLHLERVGGIWCGGDADRLQAVRLQAVEIVFDLARGCEHPARARGGRQAQEVWRVAE
jgi:hypothetical protein